MTQPLAFIIVAQVSEGKLFLKLEVMELQNGKGITYQNSPHCSAFWEPRETGQGMTFKLQRKLRDHWGGNKQGHVGTTVGMRSRQKEKPVFWYFLRQTETRKSSSDIPANHPSQWALWALTRLLLESQRPAAEDSYTNSCSASGTAKLSPSWVWILIFPSRTKMQCGESSRFGVFFSSAFLIALYFLPPLFPFPIFKMWLFTCIVSQLTVANQVCDKDRLDEGVPWRSAKNGPCKSILYSFESL